MATSAFPLELDREGRSMSTSKWSWLSGSDVDTGSEQDADEELESEYTRYEYAHIKKRPRLHSHSPSHSRSQLPQHPYQRGPFADHRWAIEPTMEELNNGEPLWTPPASPLLSPTPTPTPTPSPAHIGTARTYVPLLMRPWCPGGHGAVKVGTRAGSTSGAERRGKRRRRLPAVGTRIRVPELKRTLEPYTSSTTHSRKDYGSLRRDPRQRPLSSDLVSPFKAQSAYAYLHGVTNTGADTNMGIATDIDDGTGSGSDDSTSDSSSSTEDELCTPHQAINHFSTARRYRTSSYNISPFPSSSGLSSPVPVRSQYTCQGSSSRMHTLSSVFLTDDRWQVEPTEEEMQAGRKVGMWSCDLDEVVDTDLNGGLELDLGPAGWPAEGLSGHDRSYERQGRASGAVLAPKSRAGPANTRRSARLTSSQMQTTPTHPRRTTRSTSSAISQELNNALPQSPSNAKRRRPRQQSATPHAVALSADARLQRSATGRSSTPARTAGTASEWPTTPSRRLWPSAPKFRSPSGSSQRSRGEPDMDGWNARTSERPRPDNWASDPDDDEEDADFEYIRPLARSISSTFTSRATLSSQASMRQVSDQARHVGTHLSAKYGLADMFQHAQSLLGRCAAGAIRGADTDRHSGVIDQSGETKEAGNGLGGLSFFLGCPKRHPTLNIASPTAAHDRHGSSCRLDGERGRLARYSFEPADERGGEAGAESGENVSADDAWTSKIAALRAGIDELEKHSPDFSRRIFVHSHETGNLAFPPRPTAVGPTSQTAHQSREKEELSAYAVMMDGYRAQMEMMAAAGLRNLVIHPGAAKELVPETACKNIANNLDVLLAEYPSITVVLESMTCGPRGTLLGTSLPSLASIRSLSAYPERVKYCLDLCHVHSASHDLSTESGRGRFEVDVERYLGREHVVLVHVSECGVVGGSGGDVHRPFGQGYIGSHGIRQILRSRLFNPTLRPSDTALAADRCADQLGAHTSVGSKATGPVIIIETPRYLPLSITSSRVQNLETRRAALDIAYLHKLSSWDNATYHSHWHEWEDKWYKPRMAALRVQMRRCIAPGSAGEVGMEERIKQGRKVRAKLGSWRKRLPRATGETRGSLEGGSDPDQP